MNILLSAFACAPGHGSEPDLGWGVVRSLAAEHRVWVLTHSYHQHQIEPMLRSSALPNVRFVYVTSPVGEVPRWEVAAGESTGSRPFYRFYLHYLGWQVSAFRSAQRLLQTDSIDLVHHVTYGNSWLPSWMGWLGPPFVWSAGAKERTPRAFLGEMSPRSRRAEVQRNLAMTGLGGFTHYATAVRAKLILSASDPRCWAPRLPVRRFHLGGIWRTELDRLAAIPERDERPFRVASVGRLLGWKGFAMGLRAFAHLRREVPESEYWLVGSGPEQAALEGLASELGCAEAVRFWGWLPREQVLDLLGNVDVLVHPSLHEQFGYVLLEAMAAGRPVICLAAGGPTELVGAEGGFVLPARSPAQVVADLSRSLKRLALDAEGRLDRGRRAREWVAGHWTWEQAAVRLQDCYDDVVRQASA